MEWVELKVDTKEGNRICNVPRSRNLFVSDGYWIEIIDEHGWDGEEYYFHNGVGQLDGVKYVMALHYPEPPLSK